MGVQKGRMVQWFRAQAVESEEQSPIPNSATIGPCDFTSLGLRFFFCIMEILVVTTS